VPTTDVGIFFFNSPITQAGKGRVIFGLCTILSFTTLSAFFVPDMCAGKREYIMCDVNFSEDDCG